MNTTTRPVPPEAKVEIDFDKLRVPPELRKAAKDVIQDRETRSAGLVETCVFWDAFTSWVHVRSERPQVSYEPCATGFGPL